MGVKKELSKEQIEYIIKAYSEEFKSMSAIGKELNPSVSKTVIRRILTENNIQISSDNHKYKADYRKFKIIDSVEKAYWLGFIAADGCVYTREKNSTIRIQLSTIDKTHLEKFKKFMNANVNIANIIQTNGYASIAKPSYMSVIAFNSNDMAQDLINLGIVPNKSKLLQIPNIRSEYYLPYILGYFDGDGSLVKFANGEYNINITGTKATIEWINQVLQVSSHLEKRNANTETYHIRCGGTNKPYSIMKQLYDSCPNVHLDRKYKIYKDLEQVVLKRNFQRLLDRELLETPQS